MSDQEITARHKIEAPAESEQTRAGAVFLPAVDIYESPEALTLLADLPGVDPSKVEVDLKEGVLTLSAEAAREVGLKERILLSEYETGRFYRQFRLSEMIDQAKIEAKMKDGVLELVLPKIGPAKPKKIEVKAQAAR